ncbi:MAG: DNA mismatch repair endonuclease MutL [Clostridia bacterium]|nr:DNA mismatch repair endonuclease MutL [Clostridia bacterium]
MGIIRQLDYETAVLVAAGEMIERPLSVVKELVENSIDAGAEKITVEIQNGGISLIRCTDNGCGIAKEDLPLAIMRNATSKIRTSDDIASIMTLGFRGEALASIAAVADLRIRSKRPCDDVGNELEVHPGMESPTITEAPMADGTTIIAQNLFANIPARRKFLKKDSAEASHVIDLFERLALSNPEVAMTLIVDGKMRYNTPGDGDLHHAIYSVCGADFAGKLIELSYKSDVKIYGGGSVNASIRGYIGTPDNNFGNRQNQIFYVNGRNVRSRCLQAALEEGYTSYIDSSRFPACVMFVDIPPEFVDVNIHPTKLEVKFVAEKPIFEAVFYAVRGALERHIPRPRMELDGKSTGDAAYELTKQLGAFVPIEDRENAEPAPKLIYNNQRNVKRGQLSITDMAPPPAFDETAEAPKMPKIIADTFKSETVDYKLERQDTPSEDITHQQVYLESIPNDLTASLTADDGTPAIPQSMSHEALPQYIETQLSSPRVTLRHTEKQPSRMSDEEFKIFCEQHGDIPPQTDGTVTLPDIPSAEDFKIEVPTPIPEAEPITQKRRVPEYKILGEAFLSYLFIEVEDRVMVIDKHAAHERIIFEELRANLKDRMNSKEIPMQMLLMPLDIPLTPSLCVAVTEFEKDIRAIGYEFEIGERAASLTAIPVSLDINSARDVFEEIADKLLGGTGSAEITRDTLFEKALYQASCKAAIKVGREYDIGHLKWICDKLLTLDDIKVCPHGRPVAFEMTKSQIERQFKRI